MKKVNCVIIQENGVTIKKYDYIEPKLSKRQASFGGHFRCKINSLQIINGNDNLFVNLRK